MTNTAKYKFHSEDTGFCRVYYKSERKLYCIQDEGRGSNHDYLFYRCTGEGEPEYSIPMPEQSAFDQYILPE